MEVKCDCPTNIEDWETIPLDCPRTWTMIGEGLTKGVFQLEKSLGRRWSKSIKPQSIAELADVISVIRPGCLEAAFREHPHTGKTLSITDSYVAVRKGELEPEYIHPSLEPILKSTYGVPIYQEQIMDICAHFAGMSLLEADNIRRAIGKKDKAVMAKAGKKFIESAIKMGQPEQLATTIFTWIDEFSGYSFNKSHAVSYAMNGYQTAYAKVHFPAEFFRNMLAHSDSKIDEFDEIKELVNEAKLFGIKVEPPSINLLNSEFSFTPENNLAFGISHIKNVGPSSIPLLGKLKDCKTEEDFFNIVIVPKEKKLKQDDDGSIEEGVTKDKNLKCDAVEALIKSGTLDSIIKGRIRTLGRYRFLLELTAREQKYLKENKLFGHEAAAWVELLKLSNVPAKGRILKIEEALARIKKELAGNPARLKLAYEKYHLGMAISGSEADLYYNPRVNTTCRDFLKLPVDERVVMGVLIDDVHEFKDKNGNMMARLKISDSTYMLEAMLFSRQYMKSAWIIEPGKVVMIIGKKDKRAGSLIIDAIDHL